MLQGMKIPSLVSIQWLARAMLKTGTLPKPLRIVDATWRLKDGTIEARQDYLDNHIPGAVFFDIHECCDQSSTYPHMLPDEKIFAEYVQRLGITNDTHVIAYENNEDFGLFSSPRLWWTFRCFGHSAVSVLDGGFSKWLEARLPLESGLEQPSNKLQQVFDLLPGGFLGTPSLPQKFLLNH